MSTLIQAGSRQKKAALNYVGAPLDANTGKKGFNGALVMKQ